MDNGFDAIGIEITNESAFNDLAEQVGLRGEASVLQRETGFLHGRCLKIGGGLEVWTMLVESGRGELLYADCRPAFRARHFLRVAPWVLTEYDQEGEALVHGFIEDSETEVLFQLQNLTETGTGVLRDSLQVGLCGLAFNASLVDDLTEPCWRSHDEIALGFAASENDWSICGRVLAFEPITNPQSGGEVCWIYIDSGDIRLEVLVNQRLLDPRQLSVGSMVAADVWLQGHVVGGPLRNQRYEGIDRSVRPSDLWRGFKRPN